MKRNFIEFITVAGVLAAVPALAEDKKIDFEGQLRARTEINGKSAKDGAEVPLYTGLRTRLGAKAKASDKVDFRIEIQDSRTFGTEREAVPGKPHTASIGGGKGTLDLHQGYVDVKIGPVSTKLGRQKIKLGSQRFLSSLEWHPNARVFDGLSSRYQIWDNSRLSGLIFQVRDTSSKTRDDYLVLSGLHYAYAMSKMLAVELHGFHEGSGVNLSNYDLYNIGVRLSGAKGHLAYEEEFIYQLGSVETVDKYAFYNATRLGIKFPRSGYAAMAGLDILSGDKDAGRKSQYIANYFFAHAYFGWMDYFAANPANGVMDIRLDLDLPVHKMLLIKSQNHYFLQQDPDSNNDKPYGAEFDLELHGKFWEKSTVVLGAGVFLPGEGAELLASAGKADDKTGLFFYLMPIFNF